MKEEYPIENQEQLIHWLSKIQFDYEHSGQEEM